MKNLSDSGVASVEDRLFDGQQFLQQVTVSDRVHSRHHHLEERSLLAVLEPRDHLLPQIHSPQLKIHVVTPQIARIGQLQNTAKTHRNNLYKSGFENKNVLLFSKI